jgi:hypothetical protein
MPPHAPRDPGSASPIRVVRAAGAAPLESQPRGGAAVLGATTGLGRGHSLCRCLYLYLCLYLCLCLSLSLSLSLCSYLCSYLCFCLYLCPYLCLCSST